MNTDKYIDREENICVILCSFVATIPLLYLRVTFAQIVASALANKALM